VAVLQAAILHVLKDADAETRDELRAVLESGDAVSVDGSDLGRVRRDKPAHRWQIVDPNAYQAWVQKYIPTAVVMVAQVSSAFTSGLLKSGEWVNPETGEILHPDGLELVESEGRLVVTTTDAATEWAREVVGLNLKELE
jgi:hypothetical protein